MRSKAFTLIELLIVVAIIAILAAIAVPNFLEAQTRSKIARSQADMRSVATAIESYAVDNREYPAYGNPRDFSLFAGEVITFAPTRLTTPIAYISSLPFDPFPGERFGLVKNGPTTYFYSHNYEVVYLGRTQAGGHVPVHYRTMTEQYRAVEWELWSFGPDLDDDHGTTLYDPTNGTVSDGDMVRFGP